MAAGTSSSALYKLIKLAEIVLIGAICYVLIRAAISFFSPQSVWINPPETDLKDFDYRQGASLSIDSGFNAFNRASVQNEADAAAIILPEIGVDAPETKLNLKLYGIRYDQSGQDRGSAVLQTPDNVQKNFYIGDEVIRDVTLASVSRDFVVLSANGRLERLSTQRGANTALIASPDGEGGDEGGDEAENEAGNAASPETIGARSASVAQKLGFTVEEFISSHRISPVIEGNKLSGYELTQTKPGIDLEQFGLESGDIIVKLGQADLRQGQPDFPKLLSDLSEGRMSSLSILRGGEPVTVRVN